MSMQPEGLSTILGRLLAGMPKRPAKDPAEIDDAVTGADQGFPDEEG